MSLSNLSTTGIQSPEVVGLANQIRALAGGAVESIELIERHEVPPKVRTGMVVLADGTNWNPGAGAGVYAYYGGTWNRLG